MIPALVFALSCGNGSPTAPGAGGSLSSSPYDGTWTGAGETTGFGGFSTQISFGVSNETITTITVRYALNGCSDVRSFPDLSIPLDRIPIPGAPLALADRIADFNSGAAGEPGSTHVSFSFHVTSTAAVNGLVFVFSDCGVGGVFWTGTKNPP